MKHRVTLFKSNVHGSEFRWSGRCQAALENVIFRLTFRNDKLSLCLLKLGFSFRLEMDAEKLKNLDWMYEKPKVELEDYMLGKKIDKQLIKHVFGDDEDERASSSVGAAFQDSSILNPTYDQLCKLREDPLIAIRKAEQQKAKEMVDNPVLMKKFKTYLIEMVNEEKSKKKMKHKREDEETAGSSYKRENSRSNEKLNRKKSKSNDRKQRSRSKDRNRSNNKRRHKSRSVSVDKSTDKFQPRPIGKKHHERTNHNERSKSRSSNDKMRKSSKKSSKQKRTRSKSKSVSPGAIKKLISSSSSSVNTSSKFNSSKVKNFETKRQPYIPPKMSAEELQRKREQMMQDAKSHEKARISQLKRHEQKVAEEEKQYREQKYTEDPSRFGSTKGTDIDVAGRIRTKLNTLQRTKHADEKFLKR